MSMNEELAKFYGTNQPDQEDLEKLAAAEVAESLQETGDISLDDLDPEALEAVAREVLDSSNVEEGDDVEANEVGDDVETEKVAEAQIAEADFMGRVMAHSLHHEMRQIAESEAAEETEKTAGFKDMMGKAKEMGKKGFGKVKSYHSGAVSDLKGVADKSKSKGERAKSLGKGLAKFSPHAAAVGGAGYAAKKKMEKKSSATPAFDTLVEARMAELQQEIEASSGEGADYEVLQAAVDAAAKRNLGIE